MESEEAALSPGRPIDSRRKGPRTLPLGRDPHAITSSGYYSSLENSQAHESSGGAVASCNTGDLDSSDHEREDDKETYWPQPVGHYQGPMSDKVQLLNKEAVKDEEVFVVKKKGVMLREEQHKPPCTITCTLIPSCALKHWKSCRRCYCFVIFGLLLLISLVLGFAFFWLIQIVSDRSQVSKQVDLSSSAVVNVTSEFPPLTNLYSNKLCLDLKETFSTHLYVNKVAYVSLASEDCDSVFISPKNETVSQNSILGHNYMFYWLHGTSFVFIAEFNGTSTMSVFLLNDKRSFDLCMNRITPDKFLKKWVFNISNCGIVRDTGLMRCRFEYTVLNSGYYYICVNSTILYKLQFNISISSLVYNTSRSTTALKCIENQECCLPFGNIVKELHRPTCMFVSTSPLTPDTAGIRMSGISLRVEQRFSVFWYSMVIFLVLISAFFLTVLFYWMTRYKVKNPSVYVRGCMLQFNLYGNTET